MSDSTRRAVTSTTLDSERVLARVHAAAATLPLLVWGAFHVWEQWAVFRGRLAWLARMRATSSGLAVVAEIAFGVVPLLVWVMLHVRARLRGERVPGALRDDERGDPLAVGLGTLAPLASVVAMAFVFWHVAWLWGSKLAGAASAETYDAMQRTLGLPWALVVHAIGLFAVAWHLAAALPDGLEAIGLLDTVEGRRAARALSVVIGLCLYALTAQLVGWLGTGLGTFWPIAVVPPG